MASCCFGVVCDYINSKYPVSDGPVHPQEKHSEVGDIFDQNLDVVAFCCAGNYFRTELIAWQDFV